MSTDPQQILEDVHAQQSQIHGVLTMLDVRSRELDATVGESVQRALMGAAGLRAAQTLNQMHRELGARIARWAFGIVSACSLVPAILSWALMPSAAQITSARKTLQELNSTIEQRTREGGRVQLRRCGPASRLCVRVDRRSTFYGPDSDFMVLKGY